MDNQAPHVSPAVILPDSNYNPEEVRQESASKTDVITPKENEVNEILDEPIPESSPHPEDEGAKMKEADLSAEEIKLIDFYFQHCLQLVTTDSKTLSQLFRIALYYYEEVRRNKEDDTCPWQAYTNETFNGLTGDFLLLDVVSGLKDLAVLEEKPELYQDTVDSLLNLRVGLDVKTTKEKNGKIRVAYFDKMSSAMFEKEIEMNKIKGINDLNYKVLILEKILLQMIAECTRMLDFTSTKAIFAQIGKAMKNDNSETTKSDETNDDVEVEEEAQDEWEELQDNWKKVWCTTRKREMFRMRKRERCRTRGRRRGCRFAEEKKNK